MITSLSFLLVCVIIATVAVSGYNLGLYVGRKDADDTAQIAAMIARAGAYLEHAGHARTDDAGQDEKTERLM